MRHRERKEMIISDDKILSISKQYKILRNSRSSCYYQPKEASSETLAIMNLMDELFMAYPFYGSSQMIGDLQGEHIYWQTSPISRCKRASCIWWR
jgi:putative transposase